MNIVKLRYVLAIDPSIGIKQHIIYSVTVHLERDGQADDRNIEGRIKVCMLCMVITYRRVCINPYDRLLVRLGIR